MGMEIENCKVGFEKNMNWEMGLVGGGGRGGGWGGG